MAWLRFGRAPCGCQGRDLSGAIRATGTCSRSAPESWAFAISDGDQIVGTLLIGDPSRTKDQPSSDMEPKASGRPMKSNPGSYRAIAIAETAWNGESGVPGTSRLNIPCGPGAVPGFHPKDCRHPRDGDREHGPERPSRRASPFGVDVPQPNAP
jgi:hypothetical protein